MNARLFRYVSVGAMLTLSLGSALPTMAATAKPISPASPASTASRGAPSAPLAPPSPGAPSATGTVIYNSLPMPQAPNVPSLGFEATSTSEFGDHIAFAGTARKATRVTVLMSAWEVHSNFPLLGDSLGWMHPITLKLYTVNNAGPTPAPGTLIGSVTQNFKIPWRPEADPSCGTAWKSDSDGLCYNGYAFNIVFDLTSLNLTLPNEIIYGIAYNTADYGAAPIHAPGPYNSLNVGLASVGPSVGTDVNLDDVFWNTSYAGFYTDGGAGGVGIFRQDTNWTGYVPSARFEVAPTTVIVGPGAMNNWFFYNDETDAIDNTLGTFVAGPGTPAGGSGSAKISVTGTQRRNLATYQFAGTPLASITSLRYRIYNPSAGNGGSSNSAAYLNFNVDFNGSDTWQRRMIFLPADNGGVTQDNWKEFDAASGSSMWRYSGPTWPAPLATPGATPYSWATLLATYPGIRIRVTDAFLGLRVGEPYPDGYTENIDTLTFGSTSGTTIYDFEPAADLRFTPATTLVPVGSQVPINIDIATAGLPIRNLAGYQFDVNYNKTVLNGYFKGLYVNSFFDAASNAFKAYNPPDFNDATGLGKYGVTKTAPTPGAPLTTYTGYGTLASVSFTATAPGVSVLTFSNVLFSDAAALGLPVTSSTATVTVYGNATINGTVKLQGRATPITDGPVTLVDTSNTFAPVNTTYNATTGFFSAVVPALASGTTYRLTVDHTLYLSNTKLLTVMPALTYAQPTTTLKGGDANNTETVTVSDLSCIGSDFGTAGSTCGGLGGSDINADGVVNIFDLVIAGGNYDLVGPLPY